MKHEYDCVIVGGGPAGMSAAIALSKLGIEDVLVIERNDALGGILNQCIHLGFGLSRYHEDCSGPEYARALGREFAETGIESRLGAMVLEISKSRAVKVMLCKKAKCQRSDIGQGVKLLLIKLQRDEMIPSGPYDQDILGYPPAHVHHLEFVELF